MDGADVSWGIGPLQASLRGATL